MNGKELLDKMEFIDPAFIEDADMEFPKRKNSWIKWSVLAASFALIIYIGINVYPKNTPDNKSELPKLSISEHTSGMGYEGYRAYDVSELVNANPWNENLDLSTLPVYRNQITYDEHFVASNVNLKQMRKVLIETARKLKLNVNRWNIKQTEDTPSTTLLVKTDDVELVVDHALTVQIGFEPDVSLPSKYNFTHYAPYDDLLSVAKYLKNKYKDFIGIDNPQINISGGGYNIHARQHYSIEFFDAGANDIESIVNYNFHRAVFYCNDDGMLSLIRIYQPDLSEKIGDYPIINVEQATNLLLNGNYFTTVPYDIPGAEYVKKVELVYRRSEYETYYMPYYRFYVELPQEKLENGLKTYGAYYVPAVDGAYISNMPSFTTQ